MKAILAFFGFLFLIATSIASDGYWLWLRLYGGSLTIFWQRKPILSAPIPFLPSPGIPLWIPFASLSILLFYIFIVWKGLKIRISLFGRRLHHYHIGIVSLGLSALLWASPILFGLEEASLWIYSKRTSLAEVFEGLGFIFFLGGILLCLMDRGDVFSVVRRVPKVTGGEGKGRENRY